MTLPERRRFMYLLEQAKDGDDRACELLSDGISKEFSRLIYGLYSIDPAFDQDDLMAEFKLGIWQSIPKVEYRGDPLFHLAWRGYMAVKSLVNVIKRRRLGTDKWIDEFGERSIGTIPEGWDIPDPSEDTDPVIQLVSDETQSEAESNLKDIIIIACLSQRQKATLDLLLIDPDLNELGVNQRIAFHLGVSEQAASVLRHKTFDKLGDASEHRYDVWCLECRKQGITTKAVHQSGQWICQSEHDGVDVFYESK